MKNRLNFETLWSSIPIPAFVFDSQNCFLTHNNAAELFISTSASALQGRSLGEFISINEPLTNLINQARKGPLSLREYGVDFNWREIEPCLVDIQVTQIDEVSQTVLVMVHPRSIAEKMDRVLDHRSALRSVSGMTALLAHEIKNPLAGISGAAQLLEMELDGNDADLAQLIQKESKRIGRLLNQVEFFGEIRPLQCSSINIHHVLHQVCVAALAGFASHINIIEEYDPSLPETPGDPDQLIQLFQNLIKNAAEACPDERGIIIVRTAYRAGVKVDFNGGNREGLPLEITIIDNGPGVPPELQRHIFDPFVSSKSSGSGLGLALVAKIVTDHCGIVECGKDRDRTAFTVLLPLWTHRKNNILINDDSSEIKNE